MGSRSCREAGAEKVFATGSFWFSGRAMSAGLATLDQLEKRNAVEELRRAGEGLKAGLEKQGEELGLAVKVTGPPAMPFLSFGEDRPFSRPRGELFTQECARFDKECP